MLEVWLQKIFLEAISLNGNMQEKRYRSFKKKCQIDELLEDSTKIFLRNALERCVHRPDKSFNNGIHKEISNMCLSDLFSLFYSRSRTRKDLENDCQPVILDDELSETHHQIRKKTKNWKKEKPKGRKK